MAEERQIIDKQSPIPAYHQITSHLKERISLGEWHLGDKLPAEEALSQEYHVSRITLRQAMAELEQEGANFLAENTDALKAVILDRE